MPIGIEVLIDRFDSPFSVFSLMNAVEMDGCRRANMKPVAQWCGEGVNTLKMYTALTN